MEGESGHIAFVGNRNLKLSTVPKINYLEGKSGTTLLDDELVLVQAGVYTGVTSINYGTNGWREHKSNKLLDNLHFYAVKK